MVEDKYTREGLPIVSLDTINTFGEVLIDAQENSSDATGFRRRVERAYATIKKENPMVAKYILVSLQHCELAARSQLLDDLTGLYLILKSQAASNMLERKLEEIE